jgi:hypothetical protein
MDSKEIPKEPRQSNTKILTDIKTALKKSLEAWDPLLNNIESGLIKKDWEIISSMSKLVNGSLEKVDQVLRADKKKKADKEKSTAKRGMEIVHVSVEGGNVNVYNITDNVIVHVTEQDNKDVYTVAKNKRGEIVLKSAGEYWDNTWAKEIVICGQCGTPSMMANRMCVLCHSPICSSCIDWDAMSKTNTKQIVCKKCAQLFENCKEGS